MMDDLVAAAERAWKGREYTGWLRRTRKFTEHEFEEAIKPFAEHMFKEGVKLGVRMAEQDQINKQANAAGAGFIGLI